MTTQITVSIYSLLNGEYFNYRDEVTGEYPTESEIEAEVDRLTGIVERHMPDAEITWSAGYGDDEGDEEVIEEANFLLELAINSQLA